MPFHMHTVQSKDGHLHLGQPDVILKYGVILHGKSGLIWLIYMLKVKRTGSNPGL